MMSRLGGARNSVPFIRKGGRRTPNDAKYQDTRHRRWREKVLRRAKYLCEECRRYGRTDAKGLPVVATTAHHIKHADEYPELRFDLNNGQALCAACHAKKHPEKGGKYW